MYADRHTGFLIKHVPGMTPEIVYATAVVDQIASEAAQGRPVGGVLFGALGKGEARVVAAREMPLDDHERLLGLIAAASQDHELHSLEPLGFYRSAGGTTLSMSSADRELMDDCFPLPGQLALLFQSVPGESKLAGFFFRPERGPMKTDSTLLELKPGAVGEIPLPEFLRPPDAMLSPAVRRVPRGRVMTYAIAGGIAATMAAAGGFFWGRAKAIAAQVPQLSLHVVQSEGRLRAEWNEAAEPVIAARRGMLELRDGASRVNIPLNQTMLRNGAWPITALSDEISLRLVLETPDNGTVAEVAKFLGRATPSPSPTPDVSTEVIDLKRDIEEARAAIQAAQTENSRIDGRIAVVNRLLAARVAPPPKPAPADPSPTPPPVVQSKPISPPVAAAPPPQPAPQQPPPAAVPPPLFGDRQTASVKPPPAPQPPPAEPQRPAYSGPASGRAIWIGSLNAGATLTIEARRASTGSLNSALPPTSMRVNIFPGEISSGGLTVFSGLQRHAAGNVVEPRSALNGWLETRYVFNADRARGVGLAEAPTPGNGYKLTLRAGDRPVSVIVIDWQVVP